MLLRLVRDGPGFHRRFASYAGHGSQEWVVTISVKNLLYFGIWSWKWPYKHLLKDNYESNSMFKADSIEWIWQSSKNMVNNTNKNNFSESGQALLIWSGIFSQLVFLSSCIPTELWGAIFLLSWCENIVFTLGIYL